MISLPTPRIVVLTEEREVDANTLVESMKAQPPRSEQAVIGRSLIGIEDADLLVVFSSSQKSAESDLVHAAVAAAQTKNVPVI